MIEIEALTIKGLIAMRQVLPSQEYKLLKNRKCARESRKKRKEQSHSTLEQLKNYKHENEKLRSYINELEIRLLNAERAVRQHGAHPHQYNLVAQRANQSGQSIYRVGLEPTHLQLFTVSNTPNPLHFPLNGASNQRQSSL